MPYRERAEKYRHKAAEHHGGENAGPTPTIRDRADSPTSERRAEDISEETGEACSCPCSLFGHQI